MNVSLVAERYAKALFDLALEQQVVDEVFNDSLLIAETCEESRELRLLLESPVINTGKKMHVLEELFKSSVHPVTMTYLRIMIRKNREKFVPAIARNLVEIVNEYRNILVVRFKSPMLPDDETMKQVTALMKKYTSATVKLRAEVDESLIGGFVLSWDDKQYDASIHREIEKMRNVIAKVNLYAKKY